MEWRREKNLKKICISSFIGWLTRRPLGSNHHPLNLIESDFFDQFQDHVAITYAAFAGRDDSARLNRKPTGQSTAVLQHDALDFVEREFIPLAIIADPKRNCL